MAAAGLVIDKSVKTFVWVSRAGVGLLLCDPRAPFPESCVIGVGYSRGANLWHDKLNYTVGTTEMHTLHKHLLTPLELPVVDVRGTSVRQGRIQEQFCFRFGIKYESYITEEYNLNGGN